MIVNNLIELKDFPTCVYSSRVYRAGINRTIEIECPIESSNPAVTYYKMIPPSTRSSLKLIDNNLKTLGQMGRFRLTPNSRADFGLYECIPRNLAGSTKCNINVELGATPDPPEECIVQFAVVSNKTFARFSCKPGFNQGGYTSFLTIYEVGSSDRELLKLSGRVNINESKLDQEVLFITSADEDKYYEFLIMQENNYGNSTSIRLHLGASKDIVLVKFWKTKSAIMIATGVSLMTVSLLIYCCCCCLNDLFSSNRSENPCCQCCAQSDQLDDDEFTYTKAPLDVVTNGSSVDHGINSSEVNQSNYEIYDNTWTDLVNQVVQKSVYEEVNQNVEPEKQDHDNAGNVNKPKKISYAPFDEIIEDNYNRSLNTPQLASSKQCYKFCTSSYYYSDDEV